MKNKSNNFYFFIIVSYSILILGFFLNEDITSGGRDWHHVSKIITGFAENFKNYFPVYENRHSPIFYIILSIFKRADFNFDLIRFLHLHINLITLFFAYKCIEIKYSDLNKFFILLLSLSIILLSPNLRTAGYWPLPYPLGFLFLTIFFYYNLKYINTKNNTSKDIKYLILSIILLALSSYISPNFCLFGFHLIYVVIKKSGYKINIITIFILTSFILLLPALYYVFIYNPFFMFNVAVSNEASDVLRSNFFNKIAIISSIIFFHLFPFLLKIEIKNLLTNYKEKLKILLFLLFIYFLTIYNFNFLPEFGGGGFFYKLSFLLTGNNYFFLIILFISLIFIFLIINKNLNNFILIIIFILMNPQLSIYHKYYDPLIILTFLLFFEKGIFKKEIMDKNMIYTIFFHILFFNILYVVKNYI